ncbi:MAG: Crp/Fnr family transcriptional regulator [Gammaproteobacteria bacterium]|nr:Crp/Fnr family transcriptional regulator [Gammaproteobacteria bacterium]
MKDIEAFKDISLFNGLSSDDLIILASHSTIKHYKKNTVIVNNGDETSSLYVILEGQLNAYVDDEQGKAIILSQMGPGESFGELSLLSNKSRSASVISTSPCKLAVISGHVFMDCLTENPSIALNIIQALIEKVHNLTENVSSLALLDVYGRIVKILNKHATLEDGKRVTDRLTQQDIANMIGSSREMVSRILKDLKQGGYINMDGKSIIIEKALPLHW